MRESVICKLDIRTASGEPSAYNSNEAPYGELGDASVQPGSHQPRVGEGGMITMTSMRPGVDHGGSAGHRIAPICSDPPEKTRVLCHWCLHPFDTPPVGMPTKKLADDRFSVTGVYCSLECATAHNFDTHHASHRAYTRHALCCEMASAANQTVKPVQISPAPPRCMLNSFGGPFTIQQFRNPKEAYAIVYPLPVVAQVHQAEEMAFNDSITGGRSTRFVPIDDDAIDTFTCGLRRPNVGKRGYKSTLEYMAPSSTPDAS